MRLIARLRWLVTIAALLGLAGTPALVLARPAGSAAPPSAPAGVSIIPQTGDAYIHLNNELNTSFNHTNLDHPALNGYPDAGVLVTNQIYPYAYSAFRITKSIGVYYNTGVDQWAIYTEDQSPISMAHAWHVFIPPDDSSLIVHTTISTNVSGSATFIDHGLFNGDPAANLFVQHVYNPPGALNNYFTPTVSVAYDTGAGQWKIMTNDGTNMLEDITFFVHSASPDETSFRHVTSTSNAYLVDGTQLDNPATNGSPDAQILVTQNYGTGVTNSVLDEQVGLYYDTSDQKWVIFNESGNPMPNGVMFNVLVIPAETGAFVHTATSTNTLLNITSLNHPALNGNPFARVYVMHNWNPPEAPNEIYLDHQLGVSYVSDHWVIFNRDADPMPIGTTFNVYYTVPRANSFVAAASDTNAVTTTLRLNNPLLNNQAGALAITTFNNAPVAEAGAAYSGTVGLHYAPGGPTGYWQIFNRLGADFPTGMGVNVLIPPEASSFIHTANGINSSGNSSMITNPLTDEKPYALVFVTPRDIGSMNEKNIGVYYDGSNWNIYTEGENTQMPLGTSYNVFVVSRRVVYLPLIFKNAGAILR